MKITWTNCAEHMPPWMMHVIMHNTTQRIPRYECMTGYALCFYFGDAEDLSSIEWTAHTAEKFAYILNNLCDA